MVGSWTVPPVKFDMDSNPSTTRSAVGSGKPPVLILNLSYTGLGIARALAGRGIRVIGLSSDRRAPGNYSRFCKARLAPNSLERPEALKDFLIRNERDFAGAVIFPTRDADVLFLDRFRDVLEPRFRLGIPPRECIRRVVNKQELAGAAAKAGVLVPRTMVVSSEEELGVVASAVGFPCVVKPVSSVDWRQGQNWEAVGCRKAFLVQDLEELRKEHRRVSAVHPHVLVQEWIPGTTQDIVILGAYVGCDSNPLAYFTARKLMQCPDDFGTGCVVSNDEIPEILEPTLRLWKELEYQGMAEVEYKRDSTTGEFRLIEINTRHWDWHALGMASGVNLSWIAYCDLTGRSFPQIESASRHAKWVAEDATILYVLQGLYHGELSFRSSLQKLSGPRLYGIFEWSDPLPFLHHFFGAVLPTVGKQVWSKLLVGREIPQ